MTEDEFSRIEGGQLAGEAILFARSRPRNPDGTIGFLAKPDMPEWHAWQSYFEVNRMRRQASFMRLCWANGYSVPCRNPSTFDPTFRAEMVRRPKTMRDMGPEERAEFIEKLVRSLPKVEQRRRTSDPREQKTVAEPEVRPLTEAEMESMKRVAAAKTQRELAA